MNYLKQYTINKDDKQTISTNTRIGDKTMNIFGGNYHIPEDKYETFLQTYLKVVIEGDEPEYLTEKQAQDGKCYFDLDLHFNADVIDRKIQYDHINDFIELVIEKLQDMTTSTLPYFKIFVMIRDAPYTEEKKGITKDGVHILLDVNMSNAMQLVLRDDVLTEMSIFDDICLKNKYADVLDFSVMSKSTNTQMLGSRKPNREPYKLKHIFEVNGGIDNIIPLENWVLDIDIMRDTSMFLKSSVSIEDLTEEAMDKVKALANKKTTRKPSTSTSTNTKLRMVDDVETDSIHSNVSNPTHTIDIHSIKTIDDIQKVFESIKTDKMLQYYEYVNVLPIEYADNFEKWIRVGWALKNENKNNFIVWMLFSSRSDKFDICDVAGYFEKWNEMKQGESGLTFKSIAFWVKQEDKEAYNTLIRKNCKKYKQLCENDKITEQPLAEAFCELYGDEFLFYKEKLYNFNGVFWEETNTIHSDLMLKIGNDFRKTLIHYKNELIQQKNRLELEKETENNIDIETKIKYLVRKIERYGEIIIEIQRTAMKQNVKKEILHIISNEKVQWEEKRNLFAFNNGIYDLDTDEWVNPNPSYYMNLSTGYDYEEPTDDDVEQVEKMIEKILPDEKIRTYYMVLVATGLYGITLQKFILCVGQGRNGKGALNDFIMSMMGEYGYELNSSVLLDKIKEGVNQEIANMNNKRYVLTREPTGYALNNATIRQLTGGNTVSARGAYDKDTKKYLLLTLFMETNDKLEFKSKTEHADIERLINIPFNSFFTFEEDEVNEKKNIYPANDYITSADFRKKYRCALFKILLKYNKIYKDNGKNLKKIEPLAVKALSRAYCVNADKILKWVNQRLIKLTDEDNEEFPFVKIKDIYNRMKGSDFYNQLTKKEKRDDATYSGLCAYLKKSILYKDDYRERIDYKNTTSRNVIYGYKYEDSELCDDEETENDVLEY